MMDRRFALLRRLPPSAVARRALGVIERRPRAAAKRFLDQRRSTYGDIGTAGTLRPLLRSAIPFETVRAASSWIAPAAALYCRHIFDLLGSGWVTVAHGAPCRGLDGIRYDAASPVSADPDGAWLCGRMPAAALADSRRVWRLVDPGYQPIDWQRDVKSGFRWSDSAWSADLPIGHLPGVDVKLPWELARMQHLSTLAWAYALAAADEPGLEPAERYRAEFRNVVLDFIATNPPRFGINWRCTMDVAIRAANWVAAYDLFRLFGAAFDAPFTAMLSASLADHASHILAHLELYPEGRGNHYLADICGLAFIAAALPESPETDAWLAFAAQELCIETTHQFGADGATFEGSTSYHRLAAEMVVFATALMLGLPEGRLAALRGADPGLLRTRPRRRLQPERRFPDRDHLARIAAMAEFSRAVTKPNGRVAQIGDNDSGRFLKLHPIFTTRSVAEARIVYANLDGYDGLPANAAYLDEEILDHRPFVAAAAALTRRRDLADFAGTGWLDAAFVEALAGKNTGSAPIAAARRSARPAALEIGADPQPCREIEIVATGPDLRGGLSLEAFPDFGLWIVRSRRLFLAVRCGPLGYGGRGAHDHNDQLAIELAIDGTDWIADPGSPIYTADRRLRNAYRSVTAHFAPRCEAREPARLDLGDFWLGDEAKAQCLRFDENGFVGEHRGFGAIVRRHIVIGETTIVVRDCGLPFEESEARIRCVGQRALLARFPPAVAFSPGYGKRHRDRAITGP
ncbi:MAG TPA: heparinase II/III family protein [Stellaceae bacterium]|nr:heparinase II/III family protein [Stellaceae bacterium]